MMIAVELVAVVDISRKEIVRSVNSLFEKSAQEENSPGLIFLKYFIVGVYSE